MLYFLAAFFRTFLVNLSKHVAAGNFDGPLHGAYAAPIKAITGTPGPGMSVANITECNYTGYARQAVGTYGDPYDTVDANAAVEAPTLVFRPDDAVTPNTAVGVAYFDAITDGNLIAVDVFAVGVPLLNEFTALNYSPRVKMPFSTVYGGGAVS